MFAAFSIVAFWLLPLPLWLQIVLTVFGSLSVVINVIRNTSDE